VHVHAVTSYSVLSCLVLSDNTFTRLDNVRICITVAECFCGAANGREDQVRAGIPHGIATGETDGYWPTRGYTNSRIANSRTGQLSELTDVTGDFACLVFVFWPFIDVFLRVYLNIYNASDSVSCIMSA